MRLELHTSQVTMVATSYYTQDERTILVLYYAREHSIYSYGSFAPCPSILLIFSKVLSKHSGEFAHCACSYSLPKNWHRHKGTVRQNVLCAQRTWKTACPQLHHKSKNLAR